MTTRQPRRRSYEESPDENDAGLRKTPVVQMGSSAESSLAMRMKASVQMRLRACTTPGSWQNQIL